MNQIKKKNYKGSFCSKCNKEITIGSKSGFCRKCTPKKKHSKESNLKKSLRMIGNTIWLGRKHTEESKRKMLGRLSWNKGLKMSLVYRKKLSELHKGSKHWNWQGGISEQNRLLRNLIEYKLWREAIFKRDNYTCVWCNKKGCTLHADHIKPFALYLELRLAIDNGRTLCKECHLKTDTFGGKIKKYLGNFNNENCIDTCTTRYSQGQS